MKKIKSLFQRNYESDRLVRDEIIPGAEWVIAGEGIATLKWDGTSCLIKDRVLYKRYDAKHGKTPPQGFIPAQDPDEKTGHWPGWLKVCDGPEDQYHKEAFNRFLNMEHFNGPVRDGTYELVGPKINGNKEKFDEHDLIPHGHVKLPDAPRSYELIKNYLISNPMEGIVWHHPDGRMVKVKSKDFGIKW